MKYEEFTNEELHTLLSATCDILEIFNTQGTTSELMINAEEYGQVVKIQLLTFAEIRKREAKRAKLIEEQKQIKNQLNR